MTTQALDLQNFTARFLGRLGGQSTPPTPSCAPGVGEIDKKNQMPTPPTPPTPQNNKAVTQNGAARPAHWQIRYAAHLAALKADTAVVWVSEAVAESVAHLRTAWDWLADNDPPVGTYSAQECQARLARARVALSAHRVKPCIPLEELDRGHIAHIRAEGAQGLLDDLTERWGQMCGGPEYPDDAHALVAALEDVRGRYTHART
jgi:hypothetical protein